FVIVSCTAALGGDCNGLAEAYVRDVVAMERTCRSGPEAPRYHSCNDMRSHIKVMSQNLRRCPGVPGGTRSMAESNARRLAGAEADRRGPSPAQSQHMGCIGNIGAQCM